MLNGVHLVNFGNHRDTRMEFGPFNALVGQNGAGKSTIFRAILAYRDAQYPFPLEPENFLKNRTRPWPWWYLREGERDGIVSVGQRGRFDSENTVWGATMSGHLHPASNLTDSVCECVPNYEWHSGELRPADLAQFPKAVLPFAASAEDAMKAHIEVMSMAKTSPFGVPPAPPRKIKTVKGLSLPDALSKAAKNIHLFKAAGVMISKPSYTTVVPPRMTDNGEYLASVVANMLGSDPDRFEAMLNAFRSVIPSVKRILTRRSEIAIIEKRVISVNRKEVAYEDERNVPADTLVFETTSGNLPMEAMSEGTLMALAILTRVYAHDGPAVLLFDDIEQGLHAKAQHDLIKQLRALQAQQKDLQIILSTHSPFIIDEMTPEEVWLLHATPATGARARKLSEHPQAERALKVLSTGEFWSSEGEEWVTEETFNA